jgi:hypothetical protein
MSWASEPAKSIDQSRHERYIDMILAGDLTNVVSPLVLQIVASKLITSFTQEATWAYHLLSQAISQSDGMLMMLHLRLLRLLLLKEMNMARSSYSVLDGCATGIQDNNMSKRTDEESTCLNDVVK